MFAWLVFVALAVVLFAWLGIPRRVSIALLGVCLLLLLLALFGVFGARGL